MKTLEKLFISLGKSTLTRWQPEPTLGRSVKSAPRRHHQ